MSRLSSTDTPEETADVAEAAVDNARSDLLTHLAAQLGDGLVESHLAPDDDLWIRVTREAWVDAGDYLKTGLGFQYFNFLSAIDWMPSPFGRDMDSQVDIELGHDEASEIDSSLEHGVTGGETRFQVFARVNDIVNGLGVTLKVDVPDDDLTLASWTGVFAGADWHERECWEMYGISFDGHPGLRHIYLPSGFEGNPLRKDYPLLARRLKPWPGIVDVEQMPGDDDESGDAS
ncbi:MAG: NADH-quinone oxidoreductase subunit C [Acidimicrobiales bacterium]|nr:NADH-quinone oxidoreductase subunit C [Acidimicrobiales bacterium]MDG1875880.1 NADH-quinone oxidoreductase subunit C [Acidimicrobiales bacterium]